MKFHERIMQSKLSGDLVVQPRMGFADPARMHAGLLAVRRARASSVGTITLDSFTRVGDLASAARALMEGRDLNGFPIISHGPMRTREMLQGVHGEDFAVQVRHGSTLPDIFAATRDGGIDACEGGPVSYCIPYGRKPLPFAISQSRQCAEIAADCEMHVEVFGGCILGQLTVPSMLVALSVLEAMFFAQHGIHSVSLSYAQQTSTWQDVGSLRAMRRLAAQHLSGVDFHIVVYTYMGMFPRTIQGAQDILRESVKIAFHGAAERLIVKTVAEAHRIPTVAENVAALELAATHWRSLVTGGEIIDTDKVSAFEAIVYDEARSLIDAVLNLHVDVGEALRRAFARGILDIPYCLHKDVMGAARSVIAPDGSLQWNRMGRLPIRPARFVGDSRRLDPYEFYEMLSTVQRRFDAPYLPGSTIKPELDDQRKAA